MKTKILGILVCMLVAIGSSFTVVTSTSVEKQILVTQSNSSKQGGITLISDPLGARVIQVDSNGNIIWQKTGLDMPSDAERLANGNTLIVETSRVIEIESGGNIVWEYSGTLFWPFDAERLANGNTLIADTNNYRVIEVDTGGTIVWERAMVGLPADAERLANGNTLITEYYYENRVIEVDSSGTIVWEYGPLKYAHDVERLENGNTLITDWEDMCVIEVDSGGNIVWQYNAMGAPSDAERLANGNTLITEITYESRVIEVDSSGTIVWQKAGDLMWPFDAERITNSPDAPIIKGQTSGKAGKEYEYTFNATDPDGDNIKYHIDWGDNTSEWTGINPSGTEVKVKHKWTEDGTYNITAIAEDINGAQGPEGTLAVNIPRVRAVNRPLLLRLFERFPGMFQILRQLLRLE